MASGKIGSHDVAKVTFDIRRDPRLRLRRVAPLFVGALDGLGEMIAEQKTTVGLNDGGRPRKTPSEKEEVLPTLSSVGISHKLSSGSQKPLPIATIDALISFFSKEIDVASGTVKWFNATKGYGFIAPDGGGKDVLDRPPS